MPGRNHLTMFEMATDFGLAVLVIFMMVASENDMEYLWSRCVTLIILKFAMDYLWIKYFTNTNSNE